MYAIGLDVGGTCIKSAIIHKRKGIIKQSMNDTRADMGVDVVIDRIVNIIKDYLRFHKDKKIKGIGIGIPGMVSLDQATVQHPPNIKGWKVVNMAQEIKKRTNYPCWIGNDANVGALGSLNYGVGKKYSSFIMITLGTGVGGGIILNKKLYRGTTGAGAELGHVIIDYNGPYSNAITKGTIEAYMGQRFMSRYAADCISRYSHNPLYKQFSMAFNKLEPIDIYNAAKSGNRLAIDILADRGEKLGYAIINYIHCFDIRTIIIGGGVSSAGKYILDSARQTVLKYVLSPFKEGLEILHEKLGNDVGILGAATLVFDN